jgi:hypothetical protein
LSDSIASSARGHLLDAEAARAIRLPVDDCVLARLAPLTVEKEPAVIGNYVD